MRFLIVLFLIATACGRIEGPAGTDGVDGRDGAAGATGATGAQGPTGATGPQGSANIRVVQLCPGDSTYPNQFVEVAFCIDGRLYATYSTHGGFSTEIPPGTYSSDGVNSSCVFRVGADCEVSYE